MDGLETKVRLDSVRIQILMKLTAHCRLMVRLPPSSVNPLAQSQPRARIEKVTHCAVTDYDATSTQGASM